MSLWNCSTILRPSTNLITPIIFGLLAQPIVERANHYQDELAIKDYNKTWKYSPIGDGKVQIEHLVERSEKELYEVPVSFGQALQLSGCNQSFMFMPDERGNIGIINVNDPDPDERTKPREPEIIKVIYYASNQNASENIRMRFKVVDDEILLPLDGSLKKLAEKFNSAQDTKIIVHGFQSSHKMDSVVLIRDAYAKRGNLNIFGIDWPQARDIFLNYSKSAKFTKVVGRVVARFFDHIVENLHADPKRIHLIGHSLGAHIMGFVGNFTKHKVGRITGLDPAGPRFKDLPDPDEYLEKSDAEFVDIIHTATSYFGTGKPTGTADFYPNGGIIQPGCSARTKDGGISCSHGRAYKYFAESINSDVGFLANRCESLQQAEQHQNCTGPMTLMGDPVDHDARGIYFLKTASKPNYAIGKEYINIINN